MPSFDKGPDVDGYAPFGKNEFLRSTQDVKYEHGTFAANGIPSVTIDGSTQKVLQPGVVLARITSGSNVGKLGVFSASATDGRETLTNIVGINSTFLPWQLLHRDVEVAYVVEARVVQAWCLEYDADDVAVELSNTTADALLNKKSLSVLFA